MNQNKNNNTFKAILNFYINIKIDSVGNIEDTKFYMDEFCGYTYDFEGNKDKMLHLKSTYTANSEDELIEKIVKFLSKILQNSKAFSLIQPINNFSRMIVEFCDIEIEEKKINLTQNPHAQHIHQFNKNGNGFIRVKHLGLKELLEYSIKYIEKVLD